MDDQHATPVRSFSSALPSDLLGPLQTGVMQTRYRGVSFLKSPFDIGLYLQLFSRQVPATVIEIGTKYGGSALWFADMLTVHGVKDPRVVSVDIDPVATIVDDRIVFLRGEAQRLDAVLPSETLAGLARPWLVVEDSSHRFPDGLAVLEFFDRYLQAGDHIVVEDGILDQFADPGYLVYENGPNRAVNAFLERHRDRYQIVTELCDHYGRNVTYNPNGWLRRI